MAFIVSFLFTLGCVGVGGGGGGGVGKYLDIYGPLRILTNSKYVYSTIS